jgi:hypothetical protein
MHERLRVMKGLAIALLMIGVIFAGISGTASAAAFDRSDPAFDSFYYTPGEQLTITYTGLSTAAQYDIVIELTNGTIALEFRNQTPDSAGKLVWKFAIPADFEGVYYIYGMQNNSAVTLNFDLFYVRLFELQARLDHTVYLPGDTVTVYYFTQRQEDQKPLPGGSGHWRATINRDNGTGPDIVDNIGASFSAPQGSFTFTLPSGTKPGAYSLEVSYNDTTDKHIGEDYLTLTSGTMNVAVDLDRSTYTAGSSVVVSVWTTTSRGGSSEPTPGVQISTKVYEYDTGNATWVEDDDYSVPGQTTGVSGQVSFVIVLHDDIEDNEQYRVTVTATKGGSTPEASEYFVVRSSSTLLIDLSLDKTTYKPGDTVRARLSFISSNASLVNGAMYLWVFTNSATGAVLLEDYSAGTSTGAEKTYGISADFAGTIRVGVTIYTPDDQVYSRSDSANVFSWALLFRDLKPTYKPGETVTVNVELVSDRIGSPSFIWSVNPGSGGDPIADGSVPGNRTLTFSFTIPSTPDDSYTIRVTASGSGVVVQDSATISLEKFLVLQLTIPDQSFKPGDFVSIHWKLVPVGNATLPTAVDLQLTMTGGSGSFGSTQRFETAGTEGTVRFHIPDAAPTGDLFLTASAYDHETSSMVSYAASSLYVRSAAGASPATSASNSAGLALGVGALGVLLGLGALMMAMRKPRAPRMGAGGSSSFGELKPSAPKKDEPPMPPTSGGEPPKSL